MGIEDLSKDDLKEMANNLPLYPPLKPGGDVSIKEMYPDLTDEELDYLFSQYKGTMRKE
jgi:hypothetical protein